MKATTWFYGTSFHDLPTELPTAPAPEPPPTRTPEEQRRLDAWARWMADLPELRQNLTGPRHALGYDEHTDGRCDAFTCIFCTEEAS